MINGSEAYQKAVVADARQMVLKAVINIIDPDIVYGEGTASGQSAWSKPAQLYNKVFEGVSKYATLEHNRFMLDENFDILPDDPADTVGEVGYIGDAVCDGNCAFSTPVWYEMQFSNVSVLQACSVYFSDDEMDGIPVDFMVEVKQGGTAYYSKSFTGNAARSVSMDGFTVQNPDAIRITATKWSLPYRRMRILEIVPGIYEEWDGNILAAFEVKHQGDPSGVSVPYGTCTLKMDNLSRRFEPRSKNGIFQSIDERQGIDVMIGTALEDGAEYKRAGIFYQYSGGWKTGNNGLTMQWDLVDIVGLLANREYVPPTTLPTTLEGWISSLVSQLGTNFTDRYTVDADYAANAVTANSVDDVTGKKCGELLRYVCMAAGVWARADAETGDLAAEPLWSEGNKVTLDNLVDYPTMRSNKDLAAIIFKLYDGNNTQYVVSGNATASSETVSIDNPFIHTQSQALTAARLILSCYGGNRIELTGRGDPASEIGDVDTVWLDESSATTARRICQTLSMSGGVLRGCKSTLLQADGSFLFQNRVILTEAGTWTAPSGVTQLRVILVGRGGDGGDGTDGSWDAAGTDGADGLGALVWAETVSINDAQSFTVTIGAHTTFGQYSSANGKRFANGYTDIASGDSFARTGVSVPESGTGDGGAGGRGGVKGNRREVTVTKENEDGSTYTDWKTVIDNYPGTGKAGATGASGCVVLYYDKEAT